MAAQSRDARTDAASTSRGVDWDRTDAGIPLEDLPEPEGYWSMPFIGETAEFKANHWEWAHKRYPHGTIVDELLLKAGQPS